MEKNKMYISQKNLARLLEYMATHVRYKERYDRELCRPLEDMNREKIDSNLNMALAYADMVETLIKEQGIENPEKIIPVLSHFISLYQEEMHKLNEEMEQRKVA
jgi:hypothetical protein